jgi:Domain of unknown function (DUF4129)
MALKRAFIVALLFCLCGGSLAVAADSASSLSIPDYIAELDRLAALAANASANPHACLDAARTLPPEWQVSGEGQTFRVTTLWIGGKLEELGENPSPESSSALEARLSAMKSDAAAFAQPRPDDAAARAKLTAILSRYEFRNVHGQTWLDRFKQWFGDMVIRFLRRLFGSSAFPIVGRVLVWSLIILAVAALAFWIYRVMKRNAGIETLLPEVAPVSAKQWSKWISEAQAAAAAGKWRDAVHLAYWAGISFMEERGMWRPDKARTPREYLRLLSPGSEHRPALSTLTHEFELIWYGYKEAGPESYSETLAHLEDLGCRVS